MFKIQTLNTIAAVGLIQFPQALYEISADIAGPDAILVRSQDMHKMSMPSTLKVIGRAGAGVNNIPVAQLSQLGIPVLNTPGANANAVRELVLAGMLLASRNIYQAWQYVHDLKTDAQNINARIESDKKQFLGFELMGKKLGVIGLGSIGVKVANAAIHLGMQVIGYDPSITVSRAWELSAEARQAHNIEDLVAEADFISVHVPLTEETKHLIDSKHLAGMKENAVLLNFSRDGIVDNAALLNTLNAKKIHAYVTDFPCMELKDHPRVINLPHLGASTKEAEDNCAMMIVKQVREFLEQGHISHSANFPSLDMPYHEGDSRIAVVNANVPNMVAQISAKLASAKLNITSLVNKSRDDIAYTLIDVNNAVNSSLLNEIASITGVIQVRKVK